MTNLVEYPLLAKGAVKLLVGFPTSWECEAVFSQMSVIKTKNRNRLMWNQILELHLVQLYQELTIRIVKNKMKQAHPSH